MKRIAVVLALALVLGVFVGGRGATAQAAGHGPAYAPDEVLIQFREGVTDGQRQAARGRVNATPRKALRAPAPGEGGLEVAVLPAGSSVQAAIATLESDPNVAFAEPNWVYTRGPVVPLATANDRGYVNGSHWGLYGEATTPTNRFGSQAGEAWAHDYTGSKAVYVGVIDEGIKYDHCDLRDNVWTNPFDPANNVDDDGNGLVDDIHGWDFYHNDNTVYDPGEDNHGTHVSGTIGSAANNMACSVEPDGSGGSVGVNWNVTLISGKFLGPDGGYLEDAVRAVDYFTDLKARHGLNIVALNNSWGGGGYSQALHDAIIRAAKANILFIAAAGNDGRNNDAIPSYPSGYNTTRGTSTQSAASYDSVIAVAAIADNGSLASWSNWGRTTVDLGAPGVGIWSTTADAMYSQYSGTSMATPHVTGAAALYASVYPTATGAQIRAALLDAATFQKTASLRYKAATNGRLDISCLKDPSKQTTFTATCKRV